MKKSGSAGPEPPPDTPAAAAARKAQVDAYMWRVIAHEIRRLKSAKACKPPLASHDEIWDSIRSMLRRQDIPVEVLLFIDELQIKRSKNRPPLTIEQRTIAALERFDDIEQLTAEARNGGANDPQQRAFERAAAREKKSKLTIERRYRADLEELRAWPDFAADHPRRARPAEK